MKVLKIGVFAMALGFFAASCSNSGTTTDESTTPETEQVEPATDATQEVAPATDSTVAPATTDSTTAE